ncbi:MAG: hypothetical protein R3B57_14910 [Phycisphaerales bacterium]
MITQTLAMLVDAYRELNAKKLFWITMLLSGLVVAVFALVGIDKQGMTFAWFRLGFVPVNTDIVPRDVFYKAMFTNLGIGIWLTWVAAILALISTAGIFPQLITGGAIETVLSKPIGRVRLFLTKYTMGLLFVTLQVAVFTVASFIVIGIRGKTWEFGLFLAIPIVVVFFSYLFCVCALLGLVTRSTIAALLLTGLFWVTLFVLNAGDAALVQFRESTRMVMEDRQSRIDLAERNTARLLRTEREKEGESVEGYEPTREEMVARNPFLQRLYDGLDEDKDDLRALQKWSTFIYSAKTILPKTGETSALLERNLIDPDEITPPENDEEAADMNPTDDVNVDRDELGKRVQEVFRERSVAWVLGTSLAFEAVVLLLSCAIFARRDF